MGKFYILLTRIIYTVFALPDEVGYYEYVKLVILFRNTMTSLKSKAKTRISITIIPMVNEMLEKISARKGISKSLLIEQAIKNFLQKQLEKDVEALAKLRFNDLPNEDDWLALESSLD